MNDRGDKLRSIEERIFVDVIKDKIIKESEACNGAKSRRRMLIRRYLISSGIRYSTRKTRKLMNIHFSFFECVNMFFVIVCYKNICH